MRVVNMSEQSSSSSKQKLGELGGGGFVVTMVREHLGVAQKKTGACGARRFQGQGCADLPGSAVEPGGHSMP